MPHFTTTIAATAGAAMLAASAASAALVDPNPANSDVPQAGDTLVVTSDDASIVATFSRINGNALSLINNNAGTLGGIGIRGNSSGNINVDEVLVVDFDQDIYLDSVAFLFLNSTSESATISIVDSGGSTTFTTTVTEDFTPTGQLLVPDASTLRFAAGSSDTTFGVDTLSVTAVPEPASALAGLAGLGLVAMRRRK